MSLEIRAIELPRDAGRFVKSWWPIYEDCAEWVPPLIFERKQFFNPKKNPYFEVADVQCFMAYRDGRPVGTIAATVDHAYQEHHPGEGFFGFFEFMNDPEVAQALRDAAAAWLTEKGMHKMLGPFNFNTNHEFGLLIDGFDTPPAILNPHNADYYPGIYDGMGMEKAMDWYAYWIDFQEVPPLLARITERFMSRNPEVTLRTVDMKDFDRDAEFLYEIYQDAWQNNWGHVHLTRKEFMHMAKGLKMFIDPKFAMIAEIDGEPAALALTLPDWNKVVKGMNGRLFPFGWLHFLLGRKKADTARILILGVKQEHQRKPLGAPLYHAIWEEGIRQRTKGAEASLILENNHRMRGALEKMGFSIYKTYRTYAYPFPGVPQPEPAEETPAD